MTDAAADRYVDAPLTAADGTPLKQSLARSQRAAKLRAAMLVAPLLLFIVITFLIPILQMLWRSVENPLPQAVLPTTVEALADWDLDSDAPPGEPVFQALYADLLIATEEKTNTRLGQRLNYQASGMSSLFRKTNERRLGRFDPDAPLMPQFLEIDEDWGSVETWQTIKIYAPATTSGYLLNAVDRELTPDGVAQVSEFQQIYVTLFVRTFILSVTITLTCALLGYPIAWLLANIKDRHANLLMILVLLPFWTSLLVRTSAWKVLLQQEGVINDLLVWIGVVADNARLQMINNRTGTVIAMTHILLPFMILPLYSVMKGISPSYLRAAKSLGASNVTAFRRVYFPQTVPGIGAGSILVFILAIGYYITPELVGGTDGIFISNRIAYHISTSGNWGLAAALGTILLVIVLIFYWIYDRLVGISNVKLG